MPNLIYQQLQTWRLRDQVRTHRIHILTPCINRVAFVCPAYKLLGDNVSLDVTSWLCRVPTRGIRVCIVWPSVGIVVSSVVNWFSTCIGVNFSRNKNFHIRVSIWCVFRDSVTPALRPSGKARGWVSRHRATHVYFEKSLRTLGWPNFKFLKILKLFVSF